jgi:hypothetical protein
MFVRRKDPADQGATQLNDPAPGLDGFNGLFFRAAWDIVSLLQKV